MWHTKFKKKALFNNSNSKKLYLIFLYPYFSIRQIMNKEIPKIKFTNNNIPHIEIMNFAQLRDKLNKAVHHNPYKAHKIEFHLIMIVTKKSYTHFVDFKSYILSEGSAVFVAKNQVHHFTKSIEHASGISIVINSQFMDKYHFLSDNIKLNRLFNYHLGTPTISPSDMGEDSFLDIADLLYKEYTFENDFAKSEMLRTLLHILLLRAERAKEACSNSAVKPYWLEIFSQFKILLESEYINTRNARFYAKKLLISYKFLNDIVKLLTNKTAKAFIDHYVTIEIQRYLASTSLSVKEISYQTGFVEPANMNKFFKRNTKITPLKFRAQL